jgi:uncharacterized repeat protein (TIGR03803 family)
MHTKTYSVHPAAILAVLAAIFFPSVRANAQTETVLLNLTYNGGVGGDSLGGLIFDAAGNLYGVTGTGGPQTGGTVFKLTPSGSGTWSAKPLHDFITGPTDGQSPRASVTFDAAGNLYGTTYWGGTYNGGTVFELIPQSNGSWKEKQLHSFGGTTADGQNPTAGVILDAAGNLYGTTFIGGSSNYGTVFELSPRSNGQWKERIVHSFLSNGWMDRSRMVDLQWTPQAIFTE